MREWLTNAVRDTVASTVGWAGILFATLVAGFCAGYWIGHRGFPGLEQTLIAFGWLPLLWLGNPLMFVAYAVMALSWYLPLCYESLRLRIVAASANFLVWLIVVHSVVVQSEGAKFWRY